MFGLPGCFLYNSADALFPLVTTPAGLYGFPVPVPANPALAGAVAHAQAFLVNTTGAVVDRDERIDARRAVTPS